METKISRRDFLQYGAGAIAGLGLGAGGLWLFNDYQERNQTLANKLLEEFPNQIPGARSVEKQKVRGANKTLVHVRQAHEQEGIIPLNELLAKKDLTPEEKRNYARAVVNRFREISNNQEDIYSVLDYLIKNKGLNEIYSEGVSKSSENDVNAMAGELHELAINRVFSIGYFGEELDEKTRNLLYFIPGADKILSSKGRIKIRGCETDALNDIVYGLRNGDRELYNAGNSLREDAALDIISQNTNPLNVIVYGGEHRWLDNIHAWNQKNPTKKYSLVEVTPESYRRRE